MSVLLKCLSGKILRVHLNFLLNSIWRCLEEHPQNSKSWGEIIWIDECLSFNFFVLPAWQLLQYWLPPTRLMGVKQLDAKMHNKDHIQIQKRILNNFSTWGFMYPVKEENLTSVCLKIIIYLKGWEKEKGKERKGKKEKSFVCWFTT